MFRTIRDYRELRQHTPDAWTLIRRRRSHRHGQALPVRVRAGGSVVSTSLRGGTQDVSVFFEIFARDAYRLAALPGRLGTVIDLGANVGLFSLRAAALAERVLSFEPMPENFAQLVKNTSGLATVQAHNLAVGAGPGRLTLYGAASARGTGRFSAQPQERVHDASRRVEVDCIGLDQLLERYGVNRCDLLKIDIEGSEYDVLLGASAETLKRVNRIHGEFHPCNNRPGALDELKTTLSQSGFQTDWMPQRDNASYGMFFARRG